MSELLYKSAKILKANKIHIELKQILRWGGINIDKKDHPNSIILLIQITPQAEHTTNLKPTKMFMVREEKAMLQEMSEML